VRFIPLGVAVIAAALYFVGLGDAPFIDPPEGLHAAIARSMSESGDWAMPRLNGVRYFDEAPLLYWLMSSVFAAAGVTPFTARFWSALAAVACAAVTAHIGIMIGGFRMGLIAGLMVATNLGMFLDGRLVRPDLPFIFFIMLAYAGFVAAYLGRGGRGGLALFWGSLALATMTKDLLGAAGPLMVIGVFFWLTRERPLAHWWPSWGLALFAAIAVPWYLAIEARNRGFLWYSVVDSLVVNPVPHRVFPVDDVPLGNLEFVAVTLGAFLPWSLAAPWAVARALRQPWPSPGDRLMALFALWAFLVVGFFTFSPFKLPHYGLPALPALALLTARLWEATIARRPGAVSARALLVPLAIVFALAAAAAATAWAGALSVPRGLVVAVDQTSRNLAAWGQTAAGRPLEAFRPLLATSAAIFAIAACALAAAAWRRFTELGLTVALAAMLAFLPGAGKGMAEFARGRSAVPIAEALAARAQAGDTIVHEGSLENSASVLLALGRSVHVVNGLMANLAFGATFPDAGDIFWSPGRLGQAWRAPGRTFLISVVAADRSVVRTLPPTAVHLIVEAGGRRLYSNLAD
jgi:4-amino-4-deoxy-L-arabinose transferase-like glycosyltransferase